VLGIKKREIKAYAIISCPVCYRKIALGDLIGSACEHFRGFNLEGVALFQSPHPGEYWRAFVEIDCPVCGQRVFMKDVEKTSCRHFVSVDMEEGAATFATPDSQQEVIYLQDIRRYLADHGQEFEWVDDGTLGPVEVPKGWTIRRAWAACPDCTRTGEHQEGHSYCYAPDWKDKVMREGGLVLEGPVAMDWDWVVYYAVQK